MHLITARNVNEAWPLALRLLRESGSIQQTRNGPATVLPQPTATVYRHPVQRVLFDPVRDANPIFHHMEALWMLAGRDDATWLDQFVSDFSSRFAEQDGRMHGAYGRRWRDWFEHPKNIPGHNSMHGHPRRIDQLDECVWLLRANPHDRQAVIQMWDPSADLGVPGLKDRPCNQQVMLRCDRLERATSDQEKNVHLITGLNSIDAGTGMLRYLDITVTNRSNDAVFGAYGANVYHMSILQEYLAARIGVEVGTYTQFSNNLHMYSWSLDRVNEASAEDGARVYGGYDGSHASLGGYPATRKLVDDPESFDEDLRTFMDDPFDLRVQGLRNYHFARVAVPMWQANHHRKHGDMELALECASQIDAPDLKLATQLWLARRLRSKEAAR